MDDGSIEDTDQSIDPTNDTAESQDTGEPPPPPPVFSVSVQGPEVWDRRMTGPSPMAISQEGEGILAVTVIDSEGNIVNTLTEDEEGIFMWEGLHEDESVLPIGRYTIRATLEHEEGFEADQHTLRVIRVGTQEGKFGGADRIPLTWHRQSGPGTYFTPELDWPDFSIVSLDEGDAARPIPAIWESLAQYPTPSIEGNNVPAAYPWYAYPTLELSIEGNTSGLTVSAQIEGWTTDTAEGLPGGSFVFTKTEQLAEGPTVVEETLEVMWFAGEEMLGIQEIPTRLYATLDHPAWPSDSTRYQPWLAVIDPALRSIDGVTADEYSTTDALVEHIYRDHGLVYDTDSGASFYSWYDSWGYGDAQIDLTSYLTRANGLVINCSDAAAILGAYSNSLGVDLEYAIIRDGFSLNQIKGIGIDEFSNCPFGPSGCGFSYHAVTTLDDADTIHDATLALDGDDDPGSLPSTELLVQTIPGEEYMDRLVMYGSPRYRHIQKVEIR
ncbi:MAG: hypothetical protein CL930_13430 [Deltaproteobacteria bacterium]|nr:hypothetical protein [Deltaproteobacteria bacterium]